ncbi:MAG: hypothetical protein HY779_03320 [Rubrobacteridae bacterium]|nr:hypothetical protein [Rubrobacteridae bacterium]
MSKQKERLNVVRLKIDPKIADLDTALRNVLSTYHTISKNMPEIEIAEIAVNDCSLTTRITLISSDPPVCFCTSDSLH